MKIVRTNRRTLAVEVAKNGDITVRAPLFCTERKINEFLCEHEDWIQRTVEKQKKRFEQTPQFTKGEIEQLRQKAKREIPPLVQKYSEIMGLYPTHVSITSAKTRFGSCSGKNAVCFSLYLMRYPSEAVEYVVVHELSHIKHHNHSKSFYKTVEKYIPDYKERQKLLKNSGEDVE